ncbi:MAG: F-box protein [Candidatus Endonucleobacter bathymodioli]|uniref:F-box protein n=1 Tax=Candidatus Endonucleibacter bathymodioli TaxID=539814 RepID=A0AA90NU98_9GAMM|nr:F-box protein [Candidatus Endonucleobacter bathymodioli]
MRSVLSFIIIFVFLSLSIPQQGIAILELIDPTKVTHWTSTSNIIKIMVPIPLHKQENSIDDVTTLDGVNISLNILKNLFRFVSESNDNDEQNQETGLSKMIDTINNDDNYPVTISNINNGFDFVMIKQPKEECLGILSIKPTPIGKFVSSPDLLIEEMLSLMSIKTTEIDSQGNKKLLQMDEYSIELLEKYQLRYSETDDDTCFALYIPCKIKNVDANDNSSSCYAAFLFRQRNFDLLEALNRLSILSDDGNDLGYEEETHPDSVLMQTPLEVKEKIFKLLNLKSLFALRDTCLTTKKLIENNQEILFRSWFTCFTPQQRLSLREYVKGRQKEDIYALVTQFSTEIDIAKDLVMTRNLNYHTEIIFHTRSQLMSRCPSFKTSNIFSTNSTLGYDCKATFSPDDSYMVIHYDNVSTIYELGMSGKWMHRLNRCARFNVGVGGYNVDNSLFRVTLALFSACNRYLIICRHNGSGEIYEMDPDGKWTQKISITHNTGNISATFSPDSRHAVTTSDDGTAKIYRLDSDSSGLKEVTIKHLSKVFSAIFSDNGCSLMTASIDKNTKEHRCSEYMGLIKIHKCNSDDQWMEKLVTHAEGYVSPLAFSHDGRYVMSLHTMAIFDQNTVRIYELDSFGEWMKTPSISINHKHFLNTARFSPNGRHLATASDDGTVKIYGRYSKKNDWNKEEWSEQATIYHKSSELSATFSRDGSHLIINSCDGNATIYGLVSGETWKKKATISICVNELVKAIFSDDSSQALAFSKCHEDKIVKIYGRGQKSDDEWTQKAIIKKDKYIKSASFSADGNHVLIACADKTVSIYGWTSDNKLQTKASIQHQKNIYSARFTHDCSHVVVIDVDTSIHIWRLFLDKRTQTFAQKFSEELVNECEGTRQGTRQEKSEKKIPSSFQYKSYCDIL